LTAETELVFLSRVPFYWTNVTTSTIKIIVTIVTININSVTDITVTNNIITDYVWVYCRSQQLCCKVCFWLQTNALL